MFKKTIVILACGALIAPVAFAQTAFDTKQTNNRCHRTTDNGDGNDHHGDSGRVGG